MRILAIHHRITAKYACMVYHKDILLKLSTTLSEIAHIVLTIDKNTVQVTSNWVWLFGAFMES